MFDGSLLYSICGELESGEVEEYFVLVFSCLGVLLSEILLFGASAQAGVRVATLMNAAASSTDMLAVTSDETWTGRNLTLPVRFAVGELEYRW